MTNILLCTYIIIDNILYSLDIYYTRVYSIRMNYMYIILLKKKKK